MVGRVVIEFFSLRILESANRFERGSECHLPVVPRAGVEHREECLANQDNQLAAEGALMVRQFFVLEE